MLVHGPGSVRRYTYTATNIQMPLQRTDALQFEGTCKGSTSFHHSLAKRTSFKNFSELSGYTKGRKFPEAF
jgi:hypothetical protein